MIGHHLEADESVKGSRKVIRYRCLAKGCEARGTISTVPHKAADEIYEIVRKGHAEDLGDERADGGLADGVGTGGADGEGKS